MEHSKGLRLGIGLLLFMSFGLMAQVKNYGSMIKIQEQAFIKTTGIDIDNLPDAMVENDGTIEIKNGNWINQSNTTVFRNLNDKGEVVFTSDNGIEDAIKGKNATEFESLTVRDGVLKLENNDNIVYNVLSLINNGVLKLNYSKIIVNNEDATAIYSDNTGGIISETRDYNDPDSFNNDWVYGQLQWNIRDNKGEHIVPFINNDKESEALTLNILNTPSSEGHFVFATYPTNFKNEPLPSEINTFSGINVSDILDRYWKIENNYSSKPDVMLKFKFSDKDISMESNPGLEAEKIIAIRYNNFQNSWIDMIPGGTSSSNEVSVEVKADNLYKWWALAAKPELTTSDLITPNGDGFNDVFIPEFTKDKSKKNIEGLISIEGKIFNRWGELIYEWNGTNWWDGTYKGKTLPEGTYYWLINAKGYDGNDYNKKGTVTLLN